MAEPIANAIAQDQRVAIVPAVGPIPPLSVSELGESELMFGRPHLRPGSASWIALREARSAVLLARRFAHR